MSTLRVVFGIILWFAGSVIFNALFMFHNYNVLYVSLTMAPGILPFIPLILPRPHYGYRWIYILLGITIQFVFNYFDLLWGNLEILLIGSLGMSLIYCSFILNILAIRVALFSCSVVISVLFIFLLMKQVYIYDKFQTNDICFIYEEYCGTTCYKDYNAISCKTREWQTDVFHGSPSSSYQFGIENKRMFVRFRDHNGESVFFLEKGKLKKD